MQGILKKKPEEERWHGTYTDTGREKYNSEKAMKYYYDNKNDIMQKTK